MAHQVGPAGAGGSVAGPGPGAPIATDAGPALADGTDVGHGELVPFVSQVPGTPVLFPSFHGRRISWIAVAVITLAFLVGGFGLVFGPSWPAFWVGVGLSVIGFIMLLGVGAMDDWY